MRVAALVNWGLGLELLRALTAHPKVQLCFVVGGCAAATDDPWRNVIWDYCRQHDIPFHKAKETTNEKLASLVRQERLDLAVVHAWPAKLPREVYAAPIRGSLNFHASLLPRHRGRSPHLAALASGDMTTGLTCHVMDDGFDTGPIVAQASCEVIAGESPEALVERIKTLAAPLLMEVVIRITTPGFEPKAQDPEQDETDGPHGGCEGGA
ncbi:MAG: hypothetical protein KKB70_06490 [Proteobacteria bacterium]|nr:hypothetical protein [Pseudomonadota bacterium]MBU1612584.1 hypothetical protein [Pseudomonadota bacterium]